MWCKFHVNRTTGKLKPILHLLIRDHNKEYITVELPEWNKMRWKVGSNKNSTGNKNSIPKATKDPFNVIISKDYWSNPIAEIAVPKGPIFFQSIDHDKHCILDGKFKFKKKGESGMLAATCYWHSPFHAISQESCCENWSKRQLN